MRYVLILTLVLAGCESTTGPVCLDCGPMVASGPPVAGEVPKARPGTVMPQEGAVTMAPLAAAEGTPAPAVSEAEAAAAPGALGAVVASLGDPGRPGLWLETVLVKVPTKGKVALPDGTSVAVDLIPIEGAAGSGGRLSVAAYKALGLKITELPVLTVSAG
jgi:hypothetical protein